MKKYLIKLLLFLFIFFLFDKLFLVVADQSAEKEIDKRLELLINGQMNKDILIAGSSRGSRGIIAKQIEDSLGLSTYNISYPGSDVRFHKFLIETLMAFNDPPKYIFLVVDDNQELIKNKRTVTFRKDRLYPLVKYPYIWKLLATIENRGVFFSEFMVLNRLNKSNFDLSEKQYTPLDTMMCCGSMPISWTDKNLQFEFVEDDSYSLDKEVEDKVVAFQEMVDIIKSSGSQLIVVFPPNFKAHSPDFENRIKLLCGDGVDFYTYDINNPAYLKKSSFFDEEHLVKDAAEMFTIEIINFLKNKVSFAESINTQSEG